MQQNLNEQPPNVGDIFFHILNCDPVDTSTINFWWSQIHSKDEIQELQRLLKRPLLVGAFRKVAQVPAFGRELLPGNIGSLLRLKCDEEIEHFLLYTCSAWSKILDGVMAAAQRVDPQTVATVRLRNTMYCMTDQDFLEPLVRRGSIFSNFQSSERQIIWRNMKRFPGRIPSLAVFFEDFKYLEDVAACVKALFDIPRGQTVSQVLNQAFVSYSSATTPRSVSRDDDEKRMSRADRFDIARRRLFLFVMRHLESLRPGSILLEQDGVRNMVEATSQAQNRLAKEAYRLGFRSVKIRTKLSEDPDRVEARRSLLRARDPRHFVYDETNFESLVDRLVETYAEAQWIERGQEPCVFVADGNGECLKRRRGKPYRRAFTESAAFLTLENVHADQSLRVGELTSLFIRRDVYLAFFGPLHSPVHLNAAEASLRDDSVIVSPDVLNSGSGRYLQSRTSDCDMLDPEDPHPSEGNALTLVRQRLAERDSPSEYSLSVDEHQAAQTTDLTVVSGVEQDTDAIAFVLLEGDDQSTVERIPMDDHVQSVVEELVGRFAGRGYYPFDSNFRALALHQCVRAAMEEPDRTLLLVHEDEVRIQTFKALNSKSRKRRASEELSTRPRKLHIVDP